MKNYELLGRKWVFDRPVADLIAAWRKTDAKFALYPECGAYSELIRNKTFYPTLYHLGFGSITSAEVRHEVNTGVDLAVRYFDDKWWRPEALKGRDFSEQEIASMLEMNRIGMDKTNLKRQLKWYDPFTRGLFLAGLAGRWDDLAKIGSWFDATVEPEYQAGMLEDEYMQLFVGIAGSLSPKPMPGSAELLAKVKKCRTKRPRLLCAAWEAANAADQAAFNKAFPETVKHFLSKPEQGQIYDWVAIDQSSVWLIAEHRGLKFPPLSDKERAAVVTRESAGLAD